MHLQKVANSGRGMHGNGTRQSADHDLCTCDHVPWLEDHWPRGRAESDCDRHVPAVEDDAATCRGVRARTNGLRRSPRGRIVGPDPSP